MSLNPGTLRDRIALQRAVLAPDGVGGKDRTWQTYARLWADARPTGGHERLVAGSLRSKQGWSVTLRFRNDLTDRDRIIINPKWQGDEPVAGTGTTVGIQSVEDPDRTRERLVALCETGQS